MGLEIPEWAEIGMVLDELGPIWIGEGEDHRTGAGRAAETAGWLGLRASEKRKAKSRWTRLRLAPGGVGGSPPKPPRFGAQVVQTLLANRALWAECRVQIGELGLDWWHV